jgi:CheY-like chemotaxis protein
VEGTGNGSGDGTPNGLAGSGADDTTSGAARDETAARPVPASGNHESLRGCTVLVVDDDPRNAFVLTDVLQMRGVTVVQAGDGRNAITELLAGGIDLVLMDVMMPQMDGYATTRAIRQMPQFAKLPVITVTARAMPGDREKSIDAGATDYITKPIDVEELLTCMERWLTPAGPAPAASRPARGQ